MSKKKQAEILIANKAMLDGIAHIVTAMLEPKPDGLQHDLGRYQVAKWLIYLLAKEDAIDTVKVELAENNKHLTMARKAKGKTMRMSWGKVNRQEFIEELLEGRNDLLAHTMADECTEEQELARDDRDSYYDECMWEMGEKHDPDFNKPIVEWANIEVES